MFHDDRKCAVWVEQRSFEDADFSSGKIKMNPLSTTKSVMTWLYIYPANESASAWQKIAYKCVGCTIIGIMSFGSASHLAFILQFWSTDLEESLFVFMGFISYSGTVYTKLIEFRLQHQMHGIFETLSTIYDASKCCFLLFWKFIWNNL